MTHTSMTHTSLNHDLRIARVEETLRHFEADMPLLQLRVRELSKERQEDAKRFAAALIDQTRAELERLLRERLSDSRRTAERPSQSAN